MLSFRAPLLCAALCVAVGCTAPAAEVTEGNAESAEDALSSDSLRQRTALERARVLGAEGTLEVNYRPEQPVYPRVAFEAVQFEASSASALVQVAGDFPSSATVLVTDHEFHVMALSRTDASVEGLQQARLRIPSHPGGGFILIRDPLWSKPMDFNVTLTPLL